MKMPLLTMIVITIVPATAASCSHRHRRTLSATAKKPASVAGFRFLMLSKTCLALLFLPAAPLSLSPPALNLTIQTPNSL